jgi:NADPH:quinone reductase-like Zn-dependent oxidoreductase
MKAWIGEGAGRSAVFREATLPAPVPGPGQVLLRVRAVGLNLVDRFPKTQHFSHTPPAPAAIPGMEAAGEIAALGEGVQDRRVGERVMAMVQGGCVEYVSVHSSLLMSVPPTMDWGFAAAIPVSFLTAHDALVTNGRFARGNAVLVQGATTGVGLAALQLARLGGASLVAGTSRSADKLERARALGLQLPIEEGVAEAVLAATAGRGADVVLDHLGARVLNETLRATAVGGRVVNIGRYAGTRGEIDLEMLALRRISLIGVTFRTRSLEEHAAIVAAFMQQHAADLEAARLRPVIDRVMGFDELPAAMERAASGQQFGKLVIAL